MDSSHTRFFRIGLARIFSTALCLLTSGASRGIYVFTVSLAKCGVCDWLSDQGLLTGITCFRRLIAKTLEKKTDGFIEENSVNRSLFLTLS